MSSASRRSTSAGTVGGLQGSGRDTSEMSAAGADSTSSAAAAVSLPGMSFVEAALETHSTELEPRPGRWR
eukprot:6618442-Prymnesium_polylepis.1